MKSDFHIEPYFLPEAKRILKSAPRGDWTFALVTDSHLGDNRIHTCENIRWMDQFFQYGCLVHMGDFLCGTLPMRATQKVLQGEFTAFRQSTKAGRLFALQVNHDGYSDECYREGRYNHRDIIFDDMWYEMTGFMNCDPALQRPGNKPYYFVDVPGQRLRMIFLCTNWYEYSEAYGIYRKRYGLDTMQLCWLAETALCVPQKEWNVLLFSHIPLLRGIASTNQTGGQEAIELLTAFRDGGIALCGGKLYHFDPCGHHILAWCSGDGHGDLFAQQDGVHFVGIPCSLATVPLTWAQPMGYYPAPRTIGTENEDAWDTVIWERERQQLHFLRFGAGEDRTVCYL